MEVFPANISESFNKILQHVPSLSPFNAVVACTALWAFVKLIRMARKQVHTTRLNGPASPSFLFGVGKITSGVNEPVPVYESWAKEYGEVYEVPSTLGSRRIVLCDLKAIAHFHANDCWTYVRTPTVKVALERGIGRGLFWADGESHKRQRKSLTPAFGVSAIRKLTPIYYDSAHKAKAAWNTLIESSSGDDAIIEVQNWMNHISLDTIGLAGFSHDFGALDGKRAPVAQIFDEINSSPMSALDISVTLLAQLFPLLMWMPTPRTRMTWKLNHAMEKILNVLMTRTKKDLDMDSVGEKEEKSVIGLLIKGESSGSEFHLSKEEVLAQMKLLLFAGYETTSISMTWALIELSRNPDVQTKLRNELLEHGSDPTYDQLANGLPYLDAVVHEILRIHVPVRETVRMAGKDDIIPLAEPVRTRSGQLVESLSVAKGTSIVVPMEAINLSASIWGEDAKTFRPNRWLEDGHGHSGIPRKAREVLGHRHLLTFADGPRACIGKMFAVAEFKAVLSVLVRNFVFELPDGPDTKIEIIGGILPRPRIAGEEVGQVPLRVRPYSG